MLRRLVPLALLSACSPTELTTETGEPATSLVTIGGTANTTSGAEESTATEGEASGAATDDPDERLDLGDDVELPGCDAVDLLFIIDNSASMATYQKKLAEAFPGFIDAIFANLPPAVDLHVGITTTDFFCNGDGCNCPDSTIGCQSAAELATIEMYYTPPTAGSNGINGSQGRLFEYDGLTYYATTTDDDPAPLKAWFTGAATAAGEKGCSFEMPVAAAGYAADPANAATNGGFIRDENAVLLLFFLTDEPDKSPEPLKLHRDTLLAAKSGCGGDRCILTAGLIPPCVLGINQKLWQMMTAFSDEPPIWGDITATASYTAVIGSALAGVLGDTCLDIIIP